MLHSATGKASYIPSSQPVMIGDLIQNQPDPSSQGPKGSQGKKKKPLRIYKRPFFLKKWFLWTLATLFGLGITACIAAYFYIKPLYEKAESYDLTQIGELEKASIIYDSKGQELGRIFVQNRRPVLLQDIPFTLIQAVTAAEDSRFFNHEGVDFIGIARALLRNIKRKGSRAHGASTITMQLARDAFGLKGGIERKITEAFLAYRLEQLLTKAEILELYLNRIYFGEGYYGVLAASQGYFGKGLDDLTIAEAATLAGMPKSPNALSPRRHPEASKERRDYVIDRMFAEGVLTAEQHDKWKKAPMVTTTMRSDEGQSSYVYEQVRQSVVARIGNERALKGGFHIYTTIDSELQAAAEEAVIDRLRTIETQEGYPHQSYDDYRNILNDYQLKLKNDVIHPETPQPKPSYLQAAALAGDNETGAVRALVGGRDFEDSKYDRALLSKRAVGTAFKPIVYAAAFGLGKGYPGSLLKDTPIDNRRVMIGGLTGILGEWGLESLESGYTNREITAREALVKSKNAATVRLGETVGLENLKTTAKNMGITSPIKDYPSSYLGSSEASLAEMTLAYSAFPQSGSRPDELFFINRILSDEDAVIYERDETAHAQHQVIDPISAFQVHSCLSEVPEKGTATKVNEYGLKPMPIAGKTGTHYNFKDLWFIGYSSSITCGVWVGFDRPKTIYPGAFSNDLALPIWVDVMNAAADSYPPLAFDRPRGLQTVEICTRSGRCATDACYEYVSDKEGRQLSLRTTYPEIISPDIRIEEFCHIHSGAPRASNIIAALFTPSSEDNPTLRPGNARQGGGVQLRSPTVIGEDPYDSIQPILKTIILKPSAVLGEDDETTGPVVKRAILALPALLGEEKYQIRLPRPSSIDLSDE